MIRERIDKKSLLTKTMNKKYKLHIFHHVARLQEKIL